MVKTINWVEIPVADMARAKAFYQDVLGLKKEREGPTWTGFKVGKTTFSVALSGTKGHRTESETCKGCSPCALRLSAGDKPRTKPLPSTAALISFGVRNLDETCKALKAQGVEFLSRPANQVWGGRAALMLAPDKNIIVLCEEK